MGKRCAVIYGVIILFVILSCTRDYSPMIIGTWQMNGTDCNESGYCSNYINTDEVVEYKKDGSGVVSSASMNKKMYFNYVIHGNEIEVHIKMGIARDTIITIRDDIMLVRHTAVQGEDMGITRWKKLQ
ncbi:MAG TPA: hypothetical protein PLT75_05715 [Spirochaetota bacterium]|nr:hypothetical protein [Spirochaetota bacterium]